MCVGYSGALRSFHISVLCICMLALHVWLRYLDYLSDRSCA